MTDPVGDRFEEILAISARIEAADGTEREELEGQREELRRRARVETLAASGIDLLEHELAHVKARLAQLEAEKVGIPKWQSATGGKLTDPRAAGAEINRRLDEANGPERDKLEARVEELREAIDLVREEG